MKTEKIKNSKICFIYGASDISGTPFLPDKNRGDIVIAADAGLDFLKKSGISPDFILGDFDSLGHAVQGENVFTFPSEKDDTDTGLSVDLGVSKGADIFVIYGGLGGKRQDHTIANFQLLAHISGLGKRGFLVDKDTVFTVIENSQICFGKELSGYISVFCMGDSADGVNIKGLKYTVTDAHLDFRTALGVSNEFLSREAMISVEKGVLLINFSDPEFSPFKYLG